MTCQDVICSLCDSSLGITKDRIRKAERLAMRGGLRWSHVLAAMTKAQRKQVEKVLNSDKD